MPYLIDPVQDQGIVSIRSGGTTYSIGDIRGEGIIMDDHQQIPMILTVIHGQNGQGAEPLQSIKP